jgi:hypothetical protein
MATARATITTALRSAGIYAAGEAPSSPDMEQGLECLNDMLAAWDIEGVQLGLSTLALDDELAVPASHNKAIQDNLASDLAPIFGVALSPRIERSAVDGKSMLLALYTNPPELVMPRAVLPRPWWYGFVR